MGDSTAAKPDPPTARIHGTRAKLEDRKQQTNFQAFLNFIKSILGTGILTMPYGFNNAGYAVGTIFLLFFGLLTGYTMAIMMNAIRFVTYKIGAEQVTYACTLNSALRGSSKKGLRFVAPGSDVIINVILCLYQIGVCVVYHLFCAENLFYIVNGYYSHIPLPSSCYILIMAIPLVALMLIRNLKSLAPFSLISNLLLAAAVVIIIVNSIQEYIETNQDNAVPVAGIATIPLFFGAAMFAFSAIGPVLSIESEMRYPEYFGVIWGPWYSGVYICIIVYIFVGVVGYLGYQNEAKGVVISNLKHNHVNVVARLFCVISTIVSYPLNAHSIIHVVYDDLIVDKFDYEKLWIEYALRLVLVTITTLVSVAMQNIGILIAVLGSVCLPFLNIIFPAILDLLVDHSNGLGAYYWRVVLDTGIILIGFAGFGIGTYQSVHKMVLYIMYGDCDVDSSDCEDSGN